jgi:hypothetical protein
LRARLFIAFVLSSLVASASVHAAVVWHSLGTTSVKVTAVGAAPQEAEVRLMSARGPFATLRLEVLSGGAVTIDRLVVTYAHGSTQSIDLQGKTYEPGAFTPEIRLNGADRVIRKVTFWYTAPKFSTVRAYAH